MDADYFNDYCGHGPYAENYLWHSGIEHCISIFRRLDVRVSSALVLGAATGEVLGHFDRDWQVRPHGCEISPWAHARIPARYRRRIACADMRDHVQDMLAARRSFDLIFSNALVYLELGAIPPFLEACSRIGGHFHFWSSTSEDHEPGDRYRVTLKPIPWWRERFREAGWVPTRSPYVWRSEWRGCWSDAARKPPARARV